MCFLCRVPLGLESPKRQVEIRRNNKFPSITVSHRHTSIHRCDSFVGRVFRLGKSEFEKHTKFPSSDKMAELMEVQGRLLLISY